MPTAFLEPVAPPPLESLPRKKWTVCEIEELISLGWAEGERYELIDGELIDKRMGKLEPHAVAVLFMHEWLVSIFGFRRVRKEDPIRVAAEDNERNGPEPDLAVLREPIQHLEMRRPQPRDLVLTVEVAATTLSMDLSSKAELYARAGIPDYWVLDVDQRRMIVHRDPSGGKYTSVVVYQEYENVAPLAAPESHFPVATAFGR
jgi:Uma2 family endonuclease